MAKHVPGPWGRRWRGRVNLKGHELRARGPVGDHGVIDARRPLRGCVGFTGDVDTVAACVLVIAGFARDMVADLPAALVDGLERGPFGFDFLGDLDRRLLVFAGHRWGLRPSDLALASTMAGP